MCHRLMYFDHEKVREIPRFSGEPCPYIILNSSKVVLEKTLEKRIKGYLGWTLVKSDLELARRFTERLIEIHQNKRDIPQNDLDLPMSFWTSAIMAYARCFVSTDGRKTRLSGNRHLEHLSDDEKLKHNQMLEARHKYMAHAGLSGYEQVEFTMCLPPEKRADMSFNLEVSQIGVATPNLPTLNTYLQVIRKIIDHVEQRIKKTRQSLEEEIAKHSVDFWYEQSIPPDKDDC